MRAEVRYPNEDEEFETKECCSILQVANDEGDRDVSISRARVPPGVTTVWHWLRATDERYVVVAGEGSVEIGDLPPTNVAPGCVVRIPRDTAQRITNSGATDSSSFAFARRAFDASPTRTVSRRGRR